MMAALASSKRTITQGAGRSAEAGGEPVCGSLAGLVSILVTIAYSSPNRATRCECSPSGSSALATR
jgi:hypothetical protein